MESKRERVSRLMQQYLDNKLTPEEYSELWDLLNEDLEDGGFKEELQALWQKAKMEKALIPGEVWDQKIQLVKNKLKEPQIADPISYTYKRVLPVKRYWWAAAAIFIILISSAVFTYVYTSKGDNSAIAISKQSAAHMNDRPPGGDKALLTLADGTQIVLDSASNGILTRQGNSNIIKEKDGQLIYNNTGSVTGELVYNTLATPRGGQYQVTLPDGSRVWLNAASSLRYPAAFIGKDRKVYITGEAYFEIPKDASRPFKVQIGQLEVEVLGTHFNINGYDDEDMTRTTLLEGSVKVTTGNATNILRPGQQAQSQKNGSIKLVDNANLEETMAWKDGTFQFENSDIRAVMRQLARWYDVDVEYRGTVSKHFVGSISRDVNLSNVLAMLQQTGEVKFRIEGKKLLVMP